MQIDLRKVLKDISPTPKEKSEIKKISAEFLKKIEKGLSKENASAVLGGSIAKGTWLKGDHDIDVFVQFRADNNISKRLYNLLKKKFDKVTRIHGSRDYYRIKFKDYSFEVVPVLKINKIKDAKNVTDCSIFHIKWVKNNSDNKLKDEIRLVKQFCKTARVYGAETYIQGFSGYVLEILTIYFGSFEKFLQGIVRIRDGETIDISQHKQNLDKNKLSPIIVIDPVQGDRNAAAALSKEKLTKLQKTCWEYLKNPSYDYFIIKKKDPAELVKKYNVVIEVKALKGKDDVVGTKILKVFEYIKDKLNKEGFGVAESDWEFSEPTYLWLNVRYHEVPQEYEHMGPPISATEFAKSFRQKYKGVFQRHERLFVVLKRQNYKLNDFVDALLKEQYITERVASIKRI